MTPPFTCSCPIFPSESAEFSDSSVFCNGSDADCAFSSFACTSASGVMDADSVGRALWVEHEDREKIVAASIMLQAAEVNPPFSGSPSAVASGVLADEHEVSPNAAVIPSAKVANILLFNESPVT